MMKNLKKLKKILIDEKKNGKKISIKPPKIWLNNQDLGRVNQYDFLINSIDKVLGYKNVTISKFCPYYKDDDTINDGNWIKNSVIYSMMIRFSSAYDFDNDGVIKNKKGRIKESGTFLKSIAMLFYIKDLGVDTIYMLPVTKVSRFNKKGTAGSCYATSDFYKLDEDLKETITGDKSSVELEFKAFVEACHILGIKVIMDIIPRTIAINSDVMMQHPNWFYWIKKEGVADYKSPRVPSLPKLTFCTEDVLEDVFATDEVINHISKFTKSPDQLDKKLYNKIRQDKTLTAEKFIKIVEHKYGITVAPAFSDMINDNQPAWSDITYLRLFDDHPAKSTAILDQKGIKANPYILYDTAKSSNCPAKQPNSKLWQYLSDILVYYQKNFAIDGARIDMGHALPKELLKMIISKALKENPAFTFIAEELDPKNSATAKQDGYNVIVGDGFTKLKKLEKNGVNQFVNVASKAKLPLLACAETHDTPRISSFDTKDLRGKSITIASLFLPNTVAFLSTGQEIYEKQAMNTGLEVRENEQFLLPKNDFAYGKLALFDYTALHWDTAKVDLIADLKKLAQIRKDYFINYEDCKLYTSNKNYYAGKFKKGDNLLITALNQTTNDVLVSLDFDNRYRYDVVYSSKKNKRFQKIRKSSREISFKLSKFEFVLIVGQKLT